MSLLWQLSQGEASSWSWMASALRTLYTEKWSAHFRRRSWCRACIMLPSLALCLLLTARLQRHCVASSKRTWPQFFFSPGVPPPATDDMEWLHFATLLDLTVLRMRLVRGAQEDMSWGPENLEALATECKRKLNGNHQLGRIQH